MPLGSAAVASGAATTLLTSPYPGVHAYTAVYSGDGALAGSIAPARSERLYATFAPVISTVRDVPNDEGGKVKLSWYASPLDTFPNVTLNRYVIYRSVPPEMVAALARAAGRRIVQRTSAAGTFFWEYLATVSATHVTGYSHVAATLGDSVGGYNPRTVFMVEAQSQSGAQWWDSAPDSGYSVDNLSPVTPAPFTAAYALGATHLHWAANAEPDLAQYRLYRGTSSAFTPGPASLVVASADTGYADAGPAGGWYKLAAVDVHGNVSGYALLGPTGTTGVPAVTDAAFALSGVWPNPATGRALMASFALPDGAAARLELLDVGGRRVAVREVGALGAGRHQVDLDPDRALAAGLYMVRLVRGAGIRSARVAVIR
jgi:hypothetical protein